MNATDVVVLAALAAFVVLARLGRARTTNAPSASPLDTRRTLESRLENSFHNLYSPERRALLDHLEIAERESGIQSVCVNPPARPWRREVN